MQIKNETDTAQTIGQLASFYKGNPFPWTMIVDYFKVIFIIIVYWNMY